MEKIDNLVDLLMYELTNLSSAEKQMMDAANSLTEKATHQSLKNALKHHAGLTAMQTERLVRAKQMISEKLRGTSTPEIEEINAGFTSRGMLGLIEEANELLGTNLSHDVMDAAIIASVQKIEHYEISAYGSALAHAKQLELHEVATMINETLQEEYEADDLLTALATSAVNKQGVPGDFEISKATSETKITGTTAEDQDGEHTTISISERTINSPGGRAGTSHRRYGTGESRGH